MRTRWRWMTVAPCRASSACVQIPRAAVWKKPWSLALASWNSNIQVFWSLTSGISSWGSMPTHLLLVISLSQSVQGYFRFCGLHFQWNQKFILLSCHVCRTKFGSRSPAKRMSGRRCQWTPKSCQSIYPHSWRCGLLCWLLQIPNPKLNYLWKMVTWAENSSPINNPSFILMAPIMSSGNIIICCY